MHYTKFRVEQWIANCNTLPHSHGLAEDCLELHAKVERLTEAAAAVVKARDYLDDEMRNRGESRRCPLWDAIDNLRIAVEIEPPTSKVK